MSPFFLFPLFFHSSRSFWDRISLYPRLVLTSLCSPSCPWSLILLPLLPTGWNYSPIFFSFGQSACHSFWSTTSYLASSYGVRGESQTLPPSAKAAPKTLVCAVGWLAIWGMESVSCFKFRYISYQLSWVKPWTPFEVHNSFIVGLSWTPR